MGRHEISGGGDAGFWPVNGPLIFNSLICLHVPRRLRLRQSPCGMSLSALVRRASGWLQRLPRISQGEFHAVLAVARPKPASLSFPMIRTSGRLVALITFLLGLATANLARAAVTVF